MRNGQLKPAYNAQIGVNSEYITAFNIFCAFFRKGLVLAHKN